MKPNKLDLLILVILLLIIVKLMFSCKSSEKVYAESVIDCPATVWKYISNAEPGESDSRAEHGARLGCIRHYGEGACLVVITKTGPFSYYAICRSKISHVP